MMGSSVVRVRVPSVMYILALGNALRSSAEPVWVFAAMGNLGRQHCISASCGYPGFTLIAGSFALAFVTKKLPGKNAKQHTKNKRSPPYRVM